MNKSSKNTVAFLSTDNLEAFFVYDELLIPHFQNKGWAVDTVSWHKSDVRWDDYDAVIVRSTWDYQSHPDAFDACLARIGKANTVLENPLSLMQWNLRKTYLKSLSEQGIATIPTTWLHTWDAGKVYAQFDYFQTDQLIVKPVLSANADDTFRLNATQLMQQQAHLEALFENRELMVQPFIENILDEGEYSLFYFDGELSHTILKRPAQGDFRVQEEHGGSLALAEPDAAARQLSDATLAAMPDDALYARIDLVRHEGTYRVIELELIEPSLYFQLDEGSAARFVDAFLDRYARSVAGS